MLSEIKVILPPQFRYDAMRKELAGGIQNVIKGMTKDYENVTRTWEHKPRMIGDRGAQVSSPQIGTQIRVMVGPDPADDNSRIFGYVDKGTRPHVIRPRRAKALAFVWGGPGSYRAKTRSGFLSSTAGGPTGSLVFRKFVRHPGTKARNFTEQIQSKWQALSYREAADAVVKASRASGHAFR